MSARRGERVCRACGCDDYHACAGGCCWVEADLCSACWGREPLTDGERAALGSVRDGADVYSYSLAGTLRDIERRRPELIQIGEARMYTGDATGQMPYFGAVATGQGRALLDALAADDELPPCVGEAMRDTVDTIHRTAFEEDAP